MNETQTEPAARPGTAAATDAAVLTEVVRRLTSQFAPWQIWLFGSRARGDHSDASDFDLLVVVEGSPDVWALAGEMRWALRPLRASFDIVVEPRAFWEAGIRQVSTMEHQIARLGRLVYSREV